MHLSKRTGLDDASRLLERADEAVVVSNLIDEALRFSRGRKALAVRDVEHKGLLAKDMKVAFERFLHHPCMEPRWRGDHHGIELLAL